MRILAAILLALPFVALGAERSTVAKRAFARAHPCPATDKPIPRCPGYVIDHIIPLCAGGKDSAANMQWQKRAASYRKDVRERAYCRCLKAGGTCRFTP